jgi:hypothetical protein
VLRLDVHRQKLQARQARHSHISQRRLGLVSRPASSGRLTHLVVALGVVRFVCTGRQRASAGHKVAPPRRNQLVPRRRTRSQLPSCSASIASPSASSNSSRESGRRSTRAGATAPALAASAVSQACISMVVRGVGRRSSERHRRAADKRLLLPVIWLVVERQQARTADSEREWHTQQVSSVSSRCCWCWCARCARERSGSPFDDTLSQRELPHSRGTLAHYSNTHCCAYTCRAVRTSLFLLDDD